MAKTEEERPPPARPIRVFVLNDHRDFVEALARYLQSDASLQVVGSGQRSPAAYEQIGVLAPDVVVVDPGKNLADIKPTLALLRQAASRAAIVAVNFVFDEQYPEVARLAGADAFVAKQNVTEELIAAIHAVITPPHLGR